VTEGYGQQYYPSAVGEVNVVDTMKKHDCIIGGEGNGGVIYPELHYGRDALVGIALFLSQLAESGLSCSELRKCYPDYTISKNKIDVPPETDKDLLLKRFEKANRKYEVNTVDGVKVDMPGGWIHLRKSNTEPIIRLYAEAATPAEASRLANEARELVDELIKDL
jgi:phosphomannomutase